MMNNSIIVRNLLGNLLPFLLMGIFLPVLFEKMRRFGWFVLTQYCVITVFETIQLVTTTGSFDVDDILLNLVGAVIGWLLWMAFHRIYAGMRNAQDTKQLSV
jgi:glycopeptide antibiotics resistance protein